jgi:hypothetical protein
MKVKLKAKKDVPMKDPGYFGDDIYCTDEMDQFFGTIVSITDQDLTDDSFIAEDYYWPLNTIEKIVDRRGFKGYAKDNSKWNMFLWKQEMEEICKD